MWLSDYKEAIEALEKAIGKDCCFTLIQPSYNNEKVIFCASDLHTRYMYYIKTGKIIKYFNDRWRNSDHIDEVIKEGDK